jgi:GST-like protein
MGGIGRMMGQATYFQRIAAPNGQEDPFANKRYVDVTRRLLEISDARLDGRKWLAGDQNTIADMATYPWARAYDWAKTSVDGLDNLQAWFDRLES